MEGSKIENAASWLLERIRNFGPAEFMIWKGKSFTYSWLDGRINFFLGFLDRNLIGKGSVVGIDADYSPSVVALLLALIKQSCIIVPLTSATKEQKKEFEGIANIRYVFRFNSDNDFRVETANHKVSSELLLKLAGKNVPGLVMFSSGSTGKSKGIVHDFSKLLERYKRPGHGYRTIVFLLLDHIGGINTLIYALANRGTIIYSESRNPEDICSLIENHKVELLPTTPTFLNLLILSEQYKNHDLSSLKIISYGTEVMPESTLKKLHEIFPDTRLLQTYGLTELGIMHSKSKDSGSLFMKVGGEGYKTKIVDGNLWIKSDSAMLGYLNAPDPFSKDGWFNTGDVVVQEGEYIRVLGRDSEIINVGGQKVYPSEVENLILQVPNIKDATVKGEKNPILGNIVTARVNIYDEESRESLMKKIKDFFKNKIEPYKIPIKIEIVKEELYGARFKRMRR